MTTRTELLDRIGHWTGIGVHADPGRADEDIRRGVPFAPADYWFLVSSALLACLGLDTDSTAVIIGAMLVSPLMTPILGVGLAFGTSDRDLLKQSVRTLAIAVAVSLAIATLYFALSPLGEMTRELQARTRPTLLDAGVAFFGGIAGIVAGTRDRAGSAIPGVAIATALMPPLCTVGFGLASLDLATAAGAFYLFFINAVLIAMATYLVARLLRMPLKSVGEREASRRRVWLATVVALVLLPSTVILAIVVRDARRQRALSAFADAISARGDRTVLRWATRTDGDSVVLSLFVAGPPVTDPARDSIRAILQQRGLGDVSLRVVETGLPQSARETLAGEATLAAVKAAEAVATRTVQNEMERRLVIPNVPRLTTAELVAVQEEVRALVPEVTQVEVGVVQGAQGDSTYRRALALATVQRNGNRGRSEVTDPTLAPRLRQYLARRLSVDSVEVVLRPATSPVRATTRR